MSGYGGTGSLTERRNVLSALLLTLGLPILGAARAGEASRAAGQAETLAPVQLVMVDDLGCPYCARWDAEVGGGYANSAEGRHAPLVRIRRGDSRLARFKTITHTPTFIVLHEGAEAGRITGYPGAHFFWPMLEEILRKTGYNAAKAGG